MSIRGYVQRAKLFGFAIAVAIVAAIVSHFFPHLFKP